MTTGLSEIRSLLPPSPGPTIDKVISAHWYLILRVSVERDLLRARLLLIHSLHIEITAIASTRQCWSGLVTVEVAFVLPVQNTLPVIR